MAAKTTGRGTATRSPKQALDVFRLMVAGIARKGLEASFEQAINYAALVRPNSRLDTTIDAYLQETRRKLEWMEAGQRRNKAAWERRKEVAHG